MHNANTHLHKCQEQIIHMLLYCSPVCLSINYQLLVFPLLLYLNVEASRHIWAVWKSGSQHGRVRCSIRVRNILSGVKLFATSGASEIWAKMATISCYCSFRWPPPELATSFWHLQTTTRRLRPTWALPSLQKSAVKGWSMLNVVTLFEMTRSLYFHCTWSSSLQVKTKQWWRIPPPGSSGDLNSLRSTKRFFFLMLWQCWLYEFLFAKVLTLGFSGTGTVSKLW